MNYYDPWGHAIQIFATRLMQFVFLSIILGFALWFGVLHEFFDVELIPLTQHAITGENSTARAILVLCLALGTSWAGWLFSCLMLCGTGHQPERHHRGARIVQHDDE